MSSVTDLIDRFERPDPAYGPVPIWWWSGAPLDNERLRWQMEQLTSQGVRQAVIMCLAPGGPIFGAVADDPPFLTEAWWTIFLGACADARDLGFGFYLYDQLGFSGANFQGRLVSARPDLAGHELRRIEARTRAGEELRLDGPADSTVVAGYFVADDAATDTVPQAVPVHEGALRWDGAAGRLCLVHVSRQGFDYFSALAGATLIDTVLGEFERRAADWFGDVIVGLFEDELPSMPTWSEDFLPTFSNTYGYDLAPLIGLLWEPGGGAGEMVRRDYHAHRGTLGRRGFFDPLAAWTRRTGVIAGFDQQSPAREGDPAGGVALYGDYLGTHRSFTAPGSDHWGDSKVHSSLAHAAGHPRTWLEAFHSSGWGGTLEETYDWLAPFLRRGATLYDPHAVYYATVGGWWEWAAPSTCWRQPYWPTYAVFSGAITRLCSVLSVGSLVADTVLLHPTVASQAAMTLSGPLPEAIRCSEVYHQLNGVTAWFSEDPGVLDRAAIDYEIFDDATLASARLVDGALELGGGRFTTILLPAAAVIEARLADLLLDLVYAGGRVLCIGEPVRSLLGADRRQTARWHGAVEDGHVQSAASADAVPDLLKDRAAVARADAPLLVRRHGDALVLLITSHDERSGTQAPIIPGHRNLNWVEDSFRWDRYWTTLAERGYEFIPVGARRAHVRIPVAGELQAQRWDPRSGARMDLVLRRTEDGYVLDVPFDDGSLSVVVLAPELPAANRQAPGELISSTPIEGPWRLRAVSTMDNQWADLGDRRHEGTLPLSLWRFEHAVDAAADNVSAAGALPSSAWREVVATFGPYVKALQPLDSAELAGRITAADPRWLPAEYSLSRGIYKDPLHYEYLGPKGMVPEEFLAWPDARPGQWAAFRTRLTLPAGGERHLVLGANGRRRLFLDGVESTDLRGTGYWSSVVLDPAAATVEVEVWLRGDDNLSTSPKDGPTTGLRASFAVVEDLAAYHRPEWLVPADGSVVGSTVRLSRSFRLETSAADARVQVATEGACTVRVNGREVGRQGAFEPYTGLRQMRVHPYDVAEHLATGDNVLELEITDPGRTVAALVDSLPVAGGGLGVCSDLSWTTTRDGVPVTTLLRQEQWTDPRWVCLFARPHPLARAGWLDPATAGDTVLDLVPDAGAGTRRTEWLRFRPPVGAVSITADSNEAFSASVSGTPVSVDAQGTMRFAAPLSSTDCVLLRFETTGGHSGGGLLAGPLSVGLGEGTAPLADWDELGLRSLGGEVRYTCEFALGALNAGETIWLDLGSVRGTAEIFVNDADPKVCVWSPYRADITSDVVEGVNQLSVVIRGTLAGFLEDSSPTPAIAAGQTRSGLYGPVTLQVRAVPTPRTRPEGDGFGAA